MRFADAIPSNCWIWTAWKLLRNEGTDWAWEWTRWNKVRWIRWPHTWWIDQNGVHWEYTTRGPKRQRVLPPPLFWGEVRRVDRQSH